MVFYGHKSILRAKSSTHFGSLLPLSSPMPLPSPSLSRLNTLLPLSGQKSAPGLSLSAIKVPENSIVFNLVLHMIYSGLYVIASGYFRSSELTLALSNLL